MKAVELQAALLEQRSILTWGPVALEVLRACRAVAVRRRRIVGGICGAVLVGTS
jgi:hypothetical protein